MWGGPLIAKTLGNVTIYSQITSFQTFSQRPKRCFVMPSNPKNGTGNPKAKGRKSTPPERASAPRVKPFPTSIQIWPELQTPLTDAMDATGESMNTIIMTCTTLALPKAIRQLVRERQKKLRKLRL